MGISYLRKSTDTSAPPVFSSDGSIISMLKTVLVDGYGDTSGLGWTSEYEQTNSKLVLRNQGTRMFVRFEFNNTNKCVYIKAYESMSDIDNGLFVCPNPADETTLREFQIKLAHTSDAGSTVIPWMVLGDSKGVWIATNTGYSYYGNDSQYSQAWKFLYVGDYIPYDITNTQYNFAMFQDNVVNSEIYGNWALNAFTAVSAHYHIMRLPGRDISGAIKAGLSSGSSYTSTGLGYGENVSKASSEIQHTSIPEIHANEILLGRLPGLKNSISSYGDEGMSLTTATDILTLKPEMVFDYGDYKEHFFRYNSGYSSPGVYPSYMILTEGKGFRNVV